MNFSVKESKESDLVIKAETGNIKTRTNRTLLFSLTLQAVRIKNLGAPLLGLAKSISYIDLANLKAELPACLFLLAVGLVKIKGFGTVRLLVFSEIA